MIIIYKLILKMMMNKILFNKIYKMDNKKYNKIKKMIKV